jgi:hypothetical protein
MRGKFGAVLGVGVFLVLLLVLAGGVWGADNTICFDCHKDEALSKEDAGGKEVSLHVPEADFKASAHGKLSCSDCHTRITDDAHAAGGQQVRDHVECGVCHAKVDREYRQSLHPPIMKGTERAAQCYDCHDITPFCRAVIPNQQCIIQCSQDMQSVPLGQRFRQSPCLGSRTNARRTIRGEHSRPKRRSDVYELS